MGVKCYPKGMEMIFTDGEDLRKERKDRNLSQAELSTRSSIAPSSKHIAKIERGDVDPRLSTVLKISRALRAVPLIENRPQPFRKALRDCADEMLLPDDLTDEDLCARVGRSVEGLVEKADTE